MKAFGHNYAAPLDGTFVANDKPDCIRESITDILYHKFKNARGKCISKASIKEFIYSYVAAGGTFAGSVE